ncbi:M67 family metallopeptidase [Stakelama marina]|uniref:M67 family metallopeptidase n=1 Tax=Stakelama marina TaxID=2826939 RepID=A0A8T4IBZ4_9SPHN|nr:M67 family metallopeptidase [Stakelama marina]MBR0551901.1 M67 family metallopeptidase [Stakelama marina]
MTPQISSVLLRKIMQEARGSPNAEICGLLRGRGAVIRSAESTANCAADPSGFFEIDPSRLIAAYRQARQPNGLELLGYFHSHPAGSPDPSPRDAEHAVADGRLWLIATHDTARMWRAVSNGAVHGRFDPVAFDIVTGKRVTRSVASVRLLGAQKRWSLEFDHFPD